jgi:hypothetical protein
MVSDHRIRQTETFQFRAPPGFTDALGKAAARDYTSASEFARRALVEKLRALGVELPAPRPGQNDNRDPASFGMTA